MKIVAIGGTGLIGSKVVAKLRKKGHEALAAAPNTGVNTITGEGLTQALTGAQVVVDVANSPSFEEKAAMEFFQTASKKLIAAEMAAGVANDSPQPGRICLSAGAHQAGRWIGGKLGQQSAE